MPPDLLRLVVPETDEDELEEIRAVMATGFLTQGPKVEEFERAVGRYVHSRHAFAMSSATTALHLALVALGVGRDDEVIVPDFTFPATANVVVQQGARPVLVDIDPSTFAMDPKQLEGLITGRTRAIIPVHPFGLSADMNPILEIAHSRSIPIVEDAACAMGATYRGRPCGTMGTLGCFSFHPRKAITTGEGGMIVTADTDLAERVRLLRSHGGIRTDGRFVFEDAGFNYRLSDILAAVGVAQMRKIEAIIARKRELAAQYSTLLADVPGVTPPALPEWGGHVYQSYVVMLAQTIDRDAIIGAMRERRIETTLGTYALHAQPYFQRTLGFRPGALPNSYLAYRQSLTLPLYPRMRNDDVARVVNALRQTLSAEGGLDTRPQPSNCSS